MGSEDKDLALKYYDKALSLNSSMAMTILKKAELLQSQHKYEVRSTRPL
jgi:hypothetical protein